MSPKREISKEELYQSLIDELDNLDASIKDYDDSQTGKNFNNILKALRHLVCRGSGDHITQDYLELAGIDLSIYATQGMSIIERTDDIRSYTGSVPVNWDRSLLKKYSVGALLNSRCLLYFDGIEQHCYTWEELIREYSSKFAVHTDRRIPQIYDELKKFELGGVEVIPYLLRYFAGALSYELRATLGIATATDLRYSPAIEIAETRERGTLV